jgi:hypothetical protein
MKIQMYKIFIACSIILLFLPIFNITSESSEGKIKVYLSHDENVIIPDKTPVTIRIETLKNSNPVPSYIQIKLSLPEKNRFFSTEYPVIEGSAMTLAANISENGLLEFTTIFPIRGEYTLHVNAMPVGSRNLSNQLKNTFPIHIGEDPADIRNFALLSAVLFSLGILSGLIFQKSKRYK